MQKSSNSVCAFKEGWTRSKKSILLVRSDSNKKSIVSVPDVWRSELVLVLDVIIASSGVIASLD